MLKYCFILSCIVLCPHVVAQNINCTIQIQPTQAPKKYLEFAKLHKPSTTDLSFVELCLIFSSDQSSKLIFDESTLFEANMQEEKLNLILYTSNNLELILDRINSNQIIIEDKNGKMRFYSQQEYKDGKVYLQESIPLEDSFSYIQLKPNNPIKSSYKIYRSFISIKNGRGCIRLHYLFKPNQEQKDEGYSNLILTSNWCKVPK